MAMELHLIFNCEPSEVPAMEIHPKGYDLAISPVIDREDGTSEIVLTFRDRGIKVIDKSGPE